MFGRSESSFKAIKSTVYVLSPQIPKNSNFQSLWVKKVIFMHIWITGSPNSILFLPTSFLDVWEVWVMFHGYWIYGSRFDHPNRKNLVFQSLWVEKSIFIYIWIIGSPIPIPFLPTTLFVCMGGVSHVLRLLDQQFAFWLVKAFELKKLFSCISG